MPKARVLRQIEVDGIEYQPDTVVEFSDAMARALAQSGAIDAHKDAVSHCETTLKRQCVKHAPKAETATSKEPRESR